VTRAKALMIIIGDPHTLQNDPNWYDLLQFCSDNNGCVTKIYLGDRPESKVKTTLMSGDFNFHFKLPMKNQMLFEEDFF
jgi:helicase MOV-10